MEYYNGPDDPGTYDGSWTIPINRYQRDNLIWLFNVMGYGGPDGFWPFTRLNTGDWAGEVPQYLMKPMERTEAELKEHPKWPRYYASYTIDENDRPNSVSVSKFRESFMRDFCIRLHFALGSTDAIDYKNGLCVEDGHMALAEKIMEGKR